MQTRTGMWHTVSRFSGSGTARKGAVTYGSRRPFAPKPGRDGLAGGDSAAAGGPTMPDADPRVHYNRVVMRQGIRDELPGDLSVPHRLPESQRR